MTNETKHAVKTAAFKEFREGGVAMLNDLGLPFKVEDTWKSVAEAADYVARKANKTGERGTAQMAVAMWMHGYLECKTMEKMREAAQLIEMEKSAK